MCTWEGIIQLTHWKSHKYWHKDGRKIGGKWCRWWWHRWTRGKREKQKKWRKRRRRRMNSIEWHCEKQTEFLVRVCVYTFVFVCWRTLLSCFSSCKSISYIVCFIHFNSIENWMNDCKHKTHTLTSPPMHLCWFFHSFVKKQRPLLPLLFFFLGCVSLYKMGVFFSRKIIE